jgi:hypothetical protein
VSWQLSVGVVLCDHKTCSLLHFLLSLLFCIVCCHWGRSPTICSVIWWWWNQELYSFEWKKESTSNFSRYRINDQILWFMKRVFIASNGRKKVPNGPPRRDAPRQPMWACPKGVGGAARVPFRGQRPRRLAARFAPPPTLPPPPLYKQGQPCLSQGIQFPQASSP